MLKEDNTYLDHTAWYLGTWGVRVMSDLFLGDRVMSLLRVRRKSGLPGLCFRFGQPMAQ